MDKLKVSVIIPVYNAQQYLIECIGSVLGQTLQDFEIICVDDGSGDASDTILNEYAETDDRFVLLSQTNKGVSAARNAGIKAAKGEYIYFLDSDDYVEPDALETACKLLEAKKLDIVYFDTFAFGEEGIQQADIDAKNRYYARNHAYDAVYTGKNLLYKMLENREYSCPVWKQVIRKDFLEKNNICFYDGIIHEDELYTFQTMLLAERVAYIPKTLHHRRLRKDSIMTRPVDFTSVYGYFVCVKEAYPFLLQQGYSQKELNEFFGFLKRLMTTARNQYSKLPETEQKKYSPLPEEEKFLFQLCIADSLDVIKQRDKVAGEKQNLIKDRDAAVVKWNEAKQKLLLVEKNNTEIVKKLHDQELKYEEELRAKAKLLEESRTAVEQQLGNASKQLAEEREKNAQQSEELQRQAAELREQVEQLRQSETMMANRLEGLQKELVKEREFNQNQLEEKLRKVKQLEQIKQELAKEQAFSHKQLEEKLATSAQLEKVQKEAAKQVSELEINNEDITKKLKETEHRLKKEYENIQKQLENEKQKNNQLNNKNKEMQSNLQNIKKKAETASRELNNVKTGWSFRTGRIITFVPRKIRDWLK